MTLSVAVLSSTYFHRSGHSSRRSFIITFIRTGPKTVPCSTPPFKAFQLEDQLPSFTHCLRSVKKLLIQLKIVGGTFNSNNLCNKMLWSIRSNALEKSRRNTLTAHFDASISSQLIEYMVWRLDESTI